ncbi:polymeric immunoglobulin receptor-like isoform X2 [Silurus meridionalis]|nr:polymeric immunoglobulin receptor-like isoform X2 [Silurus meridionalis]
MTRYTGEEALQMVLDSDEEFTFLSEEDCNSDEEHLQFEERIDPFEDFPSSCYDENVAASPLPSLKTHTRPRRRRSILSSTENHPEMKILLIIFTFCLISDGGASKEVTGYLGGEVLIKCKYNTEYTQNPKYFCKGSSPGCSDLIKTGDKNMWVNSGQFSLFDDTKSAEISVMIRELTVEDTGMYQCGVDISLGNDIYTTVELKVKEGFRASTIITVCVILLLLLIGISVLLVILQKGRKMKDFEKAYDRVPREELYEKVRCVREVCEGGAGQISSLISLHAPEKSISKTVHEGGDFNVSCKYPQLFRSETKFVCKGLQPASCPYKESVKDSKKTLNVRKYFLYDDRTKQIFTVSIRNVTEQDSGEYWCGAEAAWTSDHGYKVYFTQINLIVTGFSTSTVINVGVILLLLLIGISVLLVILQKGQKMKVSGWPSLTLLTAVRMAAIRAGDNTAHSMVKSHTTPKSHTIGLNPPSFFGTTKHWPY